MDKFYWFLKNKKSIFFLMFCCLAVHIHGDIKVRYDLTTPYFQVLKSIGPQLRRLGIINSKNPDVILTNRISGQHLKGNKPIIVMEDFDFATISSRNGQYLNHPLVKAFFQAYCLNPLSLNNQERFADCYHYGLANKDADLGPNSLPKVNLDLLDKIKNVVCTDKHSINVRFNQLKKKHIDLRKKRTIDVFFAGSLTYSNFQPPLKKIYRWHRLSAIQAIKNIKGIKPFVQSGRSMPYRKYISTIQQSKIVVSPWGWGEFCYRDFEAILCGAVLIKPDTSFVKTKPNIYQNYITYIPCKPDFSDLEEKVQMVLSNYGKFAPMRYRARKMLIDYTLKIFANDFAQAVKKAMN